jgi:hypothetical protein
MHDRMDIGTSLQRSHHFDQDYYQISLRNPKSAHQQTPIVFLHSYCDHFVVAHELNRVRDQSNVILHQSVEYIKLKLRKSAIEHFHT